MSIGRLGDMIGKKPIYVTGFAVFTDYATRLDYVRDCAGLWEKGLYAELAAYQHQAFLDWRFVYGAEWEALCSRLGGAGVESAEAAMQALRAGAAAPVELPGAKLPKVTKARATDKKKAALEKVGTKRVAKKGTTKKAAAKKTAPKKPTLKKGAKKLTLRRPLPEKRATKRRR